jgi:hypothetical protein
MTTASGGVAVIATQLALTDRRALSEAWYSALHLTRAVAPLRSRAARAVPSTAARASGVHEPVPAAGKRTAIALPAPRAQRGTGARIEPVNERRRPLTETARRIERAVAFLATAPHANATAHTIDVAGGRVRLLVRSDGRTTRIVALCSRPLREQVERALAGARFALAAAP